MLLEYIQVTQASCVLTVLGTYVFCFIPNCAPYAIIRPKWAIWTTYDSFAGQRSFHGIKDNISQFSNTIVNRIVLKFHISSR